MSLFTNGVVGSRPIFRFCVFAHDNDDADDDRTTKRRINSKGTAIGGYGMVWKIRHTQKMRCENTVALLHTQRHVVLTSHDGQKGATEKVSGATGAPQERSVKVSLGRGKNVPFKEGVLFAVT
jgi:hypothetical protein